MIRWFRALDRDELVGVLIAAAFVFLLSGVTLGVSFAVTPGDIESGRVRLSPPCEYRATHGAPCPTCGLTRGFAALSHGDLHDALAHNRWSPFLYASTWLTLLGSGSLLASALRRYRRAPRAIA
jgi:hypothetical protein